MAETMFFPRSILSIGAGYCFRRAYGDTAKAIYIGVPVISLAASLGSAIHFMMGRYIFKSAAKSVIQKYPILLAIDKAIASDGVLLLTLLHMSPIVPFSILNFVVGITTMRFRDFVLSMIGVVPGTIVYIMIGTTISNVADVISGKSKAQKHQTLELVFIIVGTLLGIAGLIWTSWVTKRYFDAIILE